MSVDLDKLYICVLNCVPKNITPTLVGHAVLRHHLSSLGNERYNQWLKNNFKKCVISVNQKEFNKIKLLDDVVESSESTVLDGSTSCLTVLANKNDFNVIKFAKLWTINT